MIEAHELERASFDVTLPPNAPARLAPPLEADSHAWWQVGGATWVHALPGRSVQVQKPDETRSVVVRLRADAPGLEVEENAGWVREADAVKGLAAELVLGLLRQIDASVPAIPARASFQPAFDRQLNWPSGSPDLGDVRRRRLAGSAALAEYLVRVKGQIREGHDSDDAPISSLAERLIRHLSAIPRPSETRLSMVWNAGSDPVLSWEQSGNPELLWGVSELSYSARSLRVKTSRRRSEEADERRRLGAWAHMLAMATAVEATAGGLAVPLKLCYRTVGDPTLTATFTVASSQWGFEVPRMVLEAALGRVPEGVYLSTVG